MERKPWPVVILALIHFLEPIFKLGFYSLFWKIPVSRYLMYLQHQSSPWEQFLFLGAFPLAGLAIYAVKNWSLPVFLSIQTLTLSTHIFNHQLAPQNFPLSLVLGLSALNLCVVTYFLLPAVRMAYLDPSLRWWEALPRYVVDWKGKLSQGSVHHEVSIGNISAGGVFVQLKGSSRLAADKPLKIEFDFLTMPLELNGLIRHQSATSEITRVGIEFSDLAKTDKRRLRSGTKKLKALRYPSQRIQDDALSSFTKWAKTLLTTGKGLLPETTSRAKVARPEKTGTETKKAS